MRIITYTAIVLVILFGITFACLNADPVSINFYFNTKVVPLSILLVVVLAIGILFGLLSSFASYIRQKGENIKLQRHLKLVEKELTELRTLPIKNS